MFLEKTRNWEKELKKNVTGNKVSWISIPETFSDVDFIFYFVFFRLLSFQKLLFSENVVGINEFISPGTISLKRQVSTKLKHSLQQNRS